ncbi:uncharacterized protein LOC121879614 [Homarus americanus]|nr:uncharacterized protein LOC121879614 [Homarus americanus]
MSVLRFTLLLVVALLSAVTSQPFSHPESSRRSGFEWNSRKIGNRKVATISIRRDEERDRRSVALADDDEDDDPFSRSLLPQHHHRHQQAESTVGEGGQHHHHHHSKQQQHSHRHHHGDDEVELIEGLSPHLRDLTLARIRNLTTAKPKGNAKTKRERKGNEGRGRRGGRGGRGKKKQGKKKQQKKRRSSKKNKNKKKKKGQKVCRGLKDAETKKKCKQELKKCRKMPRAAKKECKARVDSMYRDMFNFIQSKINMSGNEACQYHRLEQCCRQADLPPQDPTTLNPVVKCHFREKFLECMQDQMADTCDPTFHTQGNMTALRNRIRQVVWSNSSCLISEALEG